MSGPARSDGARGLLVDIRVTPKSSADAVTGLWIGPKGERRIAVKVSSAPEKGGANRAALSLIAALLGAPKSAVRLHAGAKDRLKTVAVAGDPSALAARLGLWLAQRSGEGADDRGDH